jgi:predicted phage gp36 major capsid-like protein
VAAKSNEMPGVSELADRVTSLEVQVVQLRDEMRAEFSGVRNKIRDGDEETRRSVREEIRAGDEETRCLMRVLHEDLVERIKRLDRG